MESSKNNFSTPFNKVIYTLFIALGIYQAFANNSYIDAAVSLGIGLAFDPFNTEQTWIERPKWQKIWLLFHLALVALLFGLAVGIGDQHG
ncbi:hypothetical protein [Flavobacterium dankookense]|uniref:Uncharacterized protein n=1 Tax=Flavobacterium dankookense TaxID=706186 RepID=A0A4R6QEL1_9FLAO|nr:hypothetical protein [Flavobacterium dankookense]TDP61158.1 hypothetical protein BC748_0771 [Flavobacterium dankookense]